MVNWKAILSLFIIFAIFGLLLFSPKGQKITGNFTKPVGSFFKGITGKVTKSGGGVGSNKLDIIIEGVDTSSLGDTEITIEGNQIQGKLDYELISLLESKIDFDDRIINLKTGSLIGTVSFFRNGNMKIEGKTNSLKLNDMEISNPNIDFLIVGDPITYEIENIEKDKLLFSYLAGSLKCSQLTGGSLMLNNDQLELINFEGSIKQSNQSVIISGQVDRMVLNGVDISKA